MRTDALGTEITPGCYVAYDVRDGSNLAALRVGRVTGVSNRGGVPVINLVMRARHWRDDTYFAKATTLSLPDRAVVLRPDMVPASFKALLG